MDTLSALRMNGWPGPSAGQVRLTRLNIYSGLLIEFDTCQVLVDPTKLPADVAVSLHPNLLLVSHESMDHFDADLTIRYLQDPDVRLVGSWGVMMALAERLTADDRRWAQISVGVPGAVFSFGEVQVRIESSRHCEYSVPLFFDVRHTGTGFRILDLIDTDITPEMRDGSIATGADVLVVPVGIALGASPAKAWEMVRLLEPRAVFASHFTTGGSDFIAAGPAGFDSDRLMVCSWHEGLTREAGRGPVFDPAGSVAWANGTEEGESRVPAAWLSARPPHSDAVAELTRAATPEHLATALYFVAWTLLLSDGTHATTTAVEATWDRVSAAPESTAAAFLLALGVCLRRDPEARPADLFAIGARLDHKRPYFSYWVLECCGRAGENPSLLAASIDFLERAAADPIVWGEVGIRRKLMWEVDRLVGIGARWPGLVALLKKGTEDANPDVRLLAFKLLPLIRPKGAEGASLLRLGLDDPHEDVIEWAVRAHIDLFDTIDERDRAGLKVVLPRLLTHGTFQVRDRASVLAELLATF